MRPGQNMGVAIMPWSVSTAESTGAFSFDTKGFKYAQIELHVGTHATNGTGLQRIIVAESDTVTSATSQTTINSLSFSTTTSTTYVNSIPALTSVGLGGTIQINVDLRGRKRYMGVAVTCGTTTMVFGGVARLFNPETSKDTAALQSTYKGNLASTACIGVVSLVNG